MGIMYEISSAIAVSENTAFAATGEAKSSKPGRMLIKVVSQMARSGVWVHLETWPKYPLSGKPAWGFRVRFVSNL